jgi:hypothetical protein
MASMDLEDLRVFKAAEKLADEVWVQAVLNFQYKPTILSIVQKTKIQ